MDVLSVFVKNPGTRDTMNWDYNEKQILINTIKALDNFTVLHFRIRMTLLKVSFPLKTCATVSFMRPCALLRQT